MADRWRRPAHLLVVVLTLALVAVGGARTAQAVPIVCVPIDPLDPDSPIVCVPGIVGGGKVQTESGEAHVSLFATRLGIEGTADEGQAIGAVQWVDPTWEGTGLVLESIGIDYYAPVPGLDGGRELRGVMTANGQGEYPFALRAVDTGLPGSGQDRVALAVGNLAEGEAAEASDFGYSAEGALVGGDLQILTAVPSGTSPVDAGTSARATR